MYSNVGFASFNHLYDGVVGRCHAQVIAHHLVHFLIRPGRKDDDVQGEGDFRFRGESQCVGS
jgi:hypothetical protein